ncbi:MAG: zinc-ribbon domain containing protein [Desulfotomaculaceae bacterium]|nr:zinc-ribbon domain containing protein [Desulfotomaculaceae bacterium]
MMEDKLLTCKDCGKNFVFSVSEQEFFAGKGLEHAPSRCQECRLARKNKKSEAGFSRGGNSQYQNRFTRETFEAICAECGCTTEVPFKPKEDRPVYCRQCYNQKRQRY